MRKKHEASAVFTKRLIIVSQALLVARDVYIFMQLREKYIALLTYRLIAKYSNKKNDDLVVIATDYFADYLGKN